jgi:hypothetical protein
MVLLALAAASLIAPFRVSAAEARPVSAQRSGMLGDSKQDRVDVKLITRGELAQKVSNAGQFREDPGPQLFQDVPRRNKYFVYVNRLANRGAVGGYACGMVPEEPCVEPDNLPYYRPEVDALRAQAAKMIAVAAGFDDEPTSWTFQDIPVGSAFYVWVEQLAVRGIAEGFECGTLSQEPCVAPENRPYFRPFAHITKQDALKMLQATFHNEGLD